MPRKNTILDPSGHLGLNVSNFAESSKFYSKLFEVLGFKRIKLSENKAAWTTREGFGIWLYQSQTGQKKVSSAPGLQHLCFKAKTKTDVDKVYALLLKIKTRVFGEPKLMKEYLPNYYAVYFADPDGIKLEVAYY